jgi:hypothetical protein
VEHRDQLKVPLSNVLSLEVNFINFQRLVAVVVKSSSNDDGGKFWSVG